MVTLVGGRVTEMIGFVVVSGGDRPGITATGGFRVGTAATVEKCYYFC